MAGGVTLLAVLTMQLVMADVYYPPAPTSTASPVITTTMALTTLSPDVTTTVAPVVLMNALMENMRHMVSMYPSLANMHALAGDPVTSNYLPMGNQYYQAPRPVTPSMPVYDNHHVAPVPVYGGMPAAPINYGVTGYGVVNNYVTTSRPVAYGGMPNNYGSSYGITPNYGMPYGSFGPSNVYGIGSRPSGVYYGNAYHQQLPYNYNIAGRYNNQPSYSMNIAHHGPAW